MSSIGTYEWSRRGQGNLTGREKFEMIGMLVKAQLSNLVDQWRYRLGWSSDLLARVDFEAIIRPDSKVALAAEALSEALQTPVLANHCYRTYYWGALLGQVDGLKVDAELLYVGSLLHDLGLADQHVEKAAHCCFAVNGGEVAYTFALEQGWDEARCQALYNSISLHLNPTVSAAEHGAEGKLVGSGAYLDVVGLRHYCLTDYAIKQVLQRYPRETFAQEILSTMNAINHPPNSRPGFMSNLGIEYFVARNPLDKALAARG